MNIGPNGKSLIKHFEACRLTSYLPTLQDVPTIGWGSTGPDIHLGMTWTQALADARFDADVTRFASSVAAMIGDAKTTQNQFDAMCSFAYNEGAAALHGSIILADHKAGNYAGAAADFGHWVYQNHHVLNGLVTRRKAEADLYLGV